jgi:hypothetical protein
MLLRLQIVESGQFLIMAKENVLTVEIRSTLFNDQDDLLGSFSYEGTIPLEPNRHLIQNAHLINTSAKLRTLNVLMYLGAIPYKQVVFNFTITDNDINYHLFIDTSIVARQLKALKMNQLRQGNLDDSVYLGNYDTFKSYISATVTDAPGTKPMVFFPFKNDGAYKIIAPGTPGYASFDLPVNKIFNDWAVTDGVPGFTFSPAAGPYKHTFMPCFYLVYILMRIAKYFGLTPVGEWLKEETSKRIVIVSNIPLLEISTIPDVTYFMPDIGVNEFLKFARTEYGLLIDIDLTTNIMLIESFENLQGTDAILDIRDRQIAGFRETGTTLQSYTLTRPAADNDTAFSDDEKKDMPVAVIGDQSGAYEIDDIELTSVATKMITENKPGSADSWRIPYIKQPVYGSAPFDQISELAYADRSKFKIRALYWHGMVDDSGGYPYPYGSADNVDMNGKVLSTFSLAIGSAGSAILSAKRFLEFKQNSKPLEVSFFSTPGEYMKLNAKTRILIKDRNDATVSCLFDSSIADFANRSTIFAKVTVYPIIWSSNAAQVNPIIAPPPTVPPYDNGVVYVKLLLLNVTITQRFNPPPSYNITTADVVLFFYEDAAGTIPKNVIDLPVSINLKQYFQSSVSSGNYTVTSNGTTQMVAQQGLISSGQSGQSSSAEYKVNPSAKYTVL